MKSILIIAKGSTEAFRNEIIELSSEKDVSSIYGSGSDIYIAFKEAIASGFSKVSILNAFIFTDFILAADLISKYNFDFIVPIIDFFETFVDKDNVKETYLIHKYAKSLTTNKSLIIGTSNHMREFEDIESAIKTNVQKISKFSKSIEIGQGENISFVMNNLIKNEYANISLAGILAKCDFSNYPASEFGEVVFDFEISDFKGRSISYFAYNNMTGSTVENLYNFRKDRNPKCYIPISNICKDIEDALNLEEHKGKYLTAYTKMFIENNISSTLSSFVGKTITSYKNINVSMFKDSNSMSVEIEVSFSIIPVNTIEQIKVIRRL